MHSGRLLTHSYLLHFLCCYCQLIAHYGCIKEPFFSQQSPHLSSSHFRMFGWQIKTRVNSITMTIVFNYVIIFVVLLAYYNMYWNFWIKKCKSNRFVVFFVCFLMFLNAALISYIMTGFPRIAYSVLLYLIYIFSSSSAHKKNIIFGSRSKIRNPQSQLLPQQPYLKQLQSTCTCEKLVATQTFFFWLVYNPTL